MSAAEEVDERRTGLHRWAVSEAVDAHHAHVRLNGDVHGSPLGVRAVEAVAAGLGEHQLGIRLPERLGVDPEPLGNAGGEVAQHRIGAAGEPDEQLPAAR